MYYLCCSKKVEAEGGSATRGAPSKQIQTLFDRFAGADGKIDVNELQDMLTLVLASSKLFLFVY